MTTVMQRDATFLGLSLASSAPPKPGRCTPCCATPLERCWDSPPDVNNTWQVPVAGHVASMHLC